MAALTLMASNGASAWAGKTSDLGRLAWIVGTWEGVGPEDCAGGQLAYGVFTAPVLGVMSWTFRWVTPADGVIYFASDREGGAGMVDIYRVPFDGSGAGGEPENVGNLNTADTDNDMAIHPGGKYIVLMRYSPDSDDTNLYLSTRVGGADWSEPEPVTALNTDEWEFSPAFAPDSETFYFIRRGVPGILEVPFWPLVAPSAGTP